MKMCSRRMFPFAYLDLQNKWIEKVSWKLKHPFFKDVLVKNHAAADSFPLQLSVRELPLTSRGRSICGIALTGCHSWTKHLVGVYVLRVCEQKRPLSAFTYVYQLKQLYIFLPDLRESIDESILLEISLFCRTFLFLPLKYFSPFFHFWNHIMASTRARTASGSVGWLRL